ncbi:MAG TPA: class I SAM-dependent DNA methyltransferase [bacterium]|nr:class I SAM-dependent DNA methyltransferase [bacterium]
MAKVLKLEQRLWSAADQLRANSNLKSSEYSQPVLGLIFLRFADAKFSKAEKELNITNVANGKKIKELTVDDYQARGVMYLPENARYSYLLGLPEEENIGRAINEAMKSVEEVNPDLKGVLPKTYTKIADDILIGLLKNFSEIPMDVEGDMFGKIYEYFLGNFAMAEGQGGGEFFTPTSLVKLIVEIIEPYKGKVFDPACGSGGMFVQSANFIDEHKRNGDSAEKNISIYGQEKTLETVHLCKMNLAVHGLSGDVKQANTMYEDVFKCNEQFDYVMANPPFNVTGVDKEKLKDDKRFSLGLPSLDNGNYLWIQLFYNSLNKKGRAGFVMASGAESSSNNSEKEIRKKIIKEKSVDVMIAVGNNMFYTVSLPCTLWFFDKDKKNTDRKEKVLFIDTRGIYRQIDRAHREFTPEQIEYITSIVRMYRGEDASDFLPYLERSSRILSKIEPSTTEEEKEIKDRLKIIERLREDWEQYFKKNKYENIDGLCKIADISTIEDQGCSLNPGQYVGVKSKKIDDYNFIEKVINLNNELEVLNNESKKIEKNIENNLKEIIGDYEL